MASSTPTIIPGKISGMFASPSQSLFNTGSLTSGEGSFSSGFDPFSPCKEGMTPAEFEASNEFTGGLVRAEIARGGALSVLAHQVDNAKKVAEIAVKTADAWKTWGSAELGIQRYLQKMQEVAAARVDVQTAAMSINTARAGLEREGLKVQSIRAQTLADQQGTIAKLKQTRLQAQLVEQEVDAMLSGARVRFNQKGLKAPDVKLNLPQQQFKKVEVPAIDVASITRGAA